MHLMQLCLFCMVLRCMYVSKLQSFFLCSRGLTFTCSGYDHTTYDIIDKVTGIQGRKPLLRDVRGRYSSCYLWKLYFRFNTKPERYVDPASSYCFVHSLIVYVRLNTAIRTAKIWAVKLVLTVETGVTDMMGYVLWGTDRFLARIFEFHFNKVLMRDK